MAIVAGPRHRRRHVRRDVHARRAGVAARRRARGAASVRRLRRGHRRAAPQPRRSAPCSPRSCCRASRRASCSPARNYVAVVGARLRGRADASSSSRSSRPPCCARRSGAGSPRRIGKERGFVLASIALRGRRARASSACCGRPGAWVYVPGRARGRRLRRHAVAADGDAARRDLARRATARRRPRRQLRRRVDGRRDRRHGARRDAAHVVLAVTGLHRVDRVRRSSRSPAAAVAGIAVELQRCCPRCSCC